MNNSSSMRIAIVGGGPAGLTLARILQNYNVTCTVFELDKTPDRRDQGGSIDLHRNGGQQALREAGLLEEFRRVARPEGEALKLIKYDGTVVLDENVAGSRRPEEHADRPEVDRTKLRQLLLDSLQPNTVIWDKKLVSVAASTSIPGRYDLHFQDSVEEGFDLVVGADGAWSRVRNFLTEQKPSYSGVTGIELWALEVDKRHQWLGEFVGAGSCFMFDEGRAIQCQRDGENRIRVYVGVRQPEDWINTCGIDWASPEEAKKALLDRYFNDCAPDLKRAVLDANDQLIPRQMWMLPIGMRWETHPGVTLVGDAAHLMTPFAGVGVNLAMLDAMDLAKAVIGCAGDASRLPDAIRQYEEVMWERAEQNARKTEKGLIGHFSADGIDEMARRLQGR
ncbi:hypothetical protein A1O1_06201 [Capronia coronata CBS 617.96]|uniref:FAD-binding domain-containing protein n=1 Tax=Capronia coronata CBS 617.96 TaxID=1182541 RepID=W9XZ87_9EURO|nr:uncharacterized protein A1O1_06201 [Capronia coronata CBS 617.96]EXJ85832.1 hypothetical protein A1O1_06201 [Capronia coronata CBS 617.96]